MKILSINYPKQKEDEDKLELLITSYKTKMRSKVLILMSKDRCPEFDLLSKTKNEAPICTQFKHLWGRNMTFVARTPAQIFA